MGALLAFKARKSATEPVTQDELAELKRLLFMKVLADSLFMEQGLKIMEKLDKGATIEPGVLSYSKNDGVREGR